MRLAKRIQRISTPYIERNNLTIRTFNKWMVRRICAFRRKARNQAHQLALNFWHYNFARIPALHACDGGGRRGVETRPLPL